jgi:hypothetical protein
MHPLYMKHPLQTKKTNTMKKTTLIAMLMITLVLSMSAQVSVTLNLDMSDVPDFDPLTRQVDYAGSFDGWEAFHPLTQVDGDNYTITFTDIAPGYYGGDFYHNDKGAPDWGTYGEWAGAPTGIDILVYVEDQDRTLNIKWGATYSITCHVDMNEVTEFDPATDSVYFDSEEVGPLNKVAMIDDNEDGIYSVTIDGIPTGDFPTVFAYGPNKGELTFEWEYASNKGLRVLEIADADIEEGYKFGETTGTIVQGVDVTINLSMRDTDFNEDTDVLYLSGEFNGWASPGSDPAYKFIKSGLGIYSLTLTGIAPGYYMNDIYRDLEGLENWGANGEWSGAPTGIDLMTFVGEEDVSFDCTWGQVLNMNLQVDMNNVGGFDPASDTVYYINRGVSALNQSVMTDDNADGIYVLVLDSIPQGYFPSIFAYGSASADDLTSEWPWADMANRVLVLGEDDINQRYVFGEAQGVNTTGVREIKSAGRLAVHIYPNPVTGGLLYISLQDPGQGTTVRLFDPQGKEVYNRPVQNQSLHTMDIHHLGSGLYILKIDAGTQSHTFKIVKQ